MNSDQQPRNVLVINCGSSSLKYQLLEMNREKLLAKGLIERIGLKEGIHTFGRPGHDDLVSEHPVADHAVAIELLLAALVDRDSGVIGSMAEVSRKGDKLKISLGGFKLDLVPGKDGKFAVSHWMERWG